MNGSGLRYASGGFLAKGGLFEAQWSLKGCEMEASIHTPKGLKGTVYLPTFAFNYTQYRSTFDNTKVNVPKVFGAYFLLRNVTGGNHIARLVSKQKLITQKTNDVKGRSW